MVESNAIHKYQKLRPYLPVHLANRFSTRMSVEDGVAISDHISCLRNVLATYLPRHLVGLINEDPTPGRMIGRFLQGSVVFADVSGFTAMSERLSVLGKEGAEEMTLIVNDYFETMLEISNRYGGDLLKFGGDALMIFFEGMEGPYRAITVAREMQYSMSKYQGVETSKGTFALRMSVGIGSGPIFLINLGSVDEMNYAVMGSALVGMTKAENLATAGQIIVDRATREATMDIASFTVAGDDLWLLRTLQPWKFVAQDRVQERQPESSKTASSVEDLLDKCLHDLAFIEALKPYVPDELFIRLIPDPERPIRYGSHRPVTMMFANFYGIDEIIDALGKGRLDVISKLLNEYFASMSMVINQYGGTISRVDPYIVGHRILALFGALQAHEDDPERAVRVGLAMNRVLEGVNQRLNEILRSVPGVEVNLSERLLKQRIGINTGFVFAGNVGSSDRREFTVMGDQVNLTARLMSVSEDGEVLIGQNTSRHVKAAFNLNEKEPVRVKGITDPVRNYLVVVEVEKREQQMKIGVSPLVGRDAELEKGRLAVERSLSGKGCLLVVHGVSGIGKTRLVDEIVSHEIAGGMELLMGTCLSYGNTLTYHPWAEVLKAYFRIQPTDDHEARVSAVEVGLGMVGEGAWAPVIGAVLGLDIPDNDLTRDLDAKLRRQRVLDLVVKLLQVRSQEQPLILEIEDAHWADSASMELVNYVARSIAGYAILMIIPHRPDAGLPDWTSYKHAIEIPLRDLSEQASMDVVQGMLGLVQLPDSIRELILNKTSGNPFFIKEVVHALIDAGALEQDDFGQWQVVEGTEYVELPDTIHGIVMSRVDRLDATHRRILQAASVVGRVFPYQILSGVYAVDEPDVQIRPCLASMQDVDLIEVQDVDLDHYRFTHLTTQEVVYDSLSFELRRSLHRGIGNYLEATYAETLSEQIDLLAYHYFMGQAWSKAVDYNLLAGQRAQREYANDVAIASGHKVLLAVEKLDPVVETLKGCISANEMLGDVYTLVGKYDEAMENYASARSVVEKLPPSIDQDHFLADLCRKIAEVHERRSEYEDAFDWLERGLSYLNLEEARIETIRIYILRSGILYRQGKFDQALAWCEESLSIASEIKTREGQQAVGHIYHLMGSIYVRLGDLERSAESSRQSVRVYEEIDHIVGQAKAYNNLGNAYTSLGEWSLASDVLQRSLSINREIGDIQEQGFVTNNLGNIYLNRGEWDLAAQHFIESSDVWKRIGAAMFEGVTVSNLAQVYISQGNWAAARVSLSRSQALFKEAGSEGFLPELERRWGQYYLCQGELDQAYEHLIRSVQMASSQEARSELGMSFRILGEVYLERGELEASEMALLRSLRILSDLKSEYEAAKTVLTLARLALAGRVALDRFQLERAVQTFEKLGAQTELVRLGDLFNKLEESGF